MAFLIWMSSIYHLKLNVKFCFPGTYKLKKNDLQQDSFDPTKTTDTIFYLNITSGEYEKVTPEIYTKINDGSIRL